MSESTTNEPTEPGSEESSPGENDRKNWSDVLLAVIPGEVTAVYLGIRSTVAMIGQTEEAIGAYVPYVLLISAVLLVLITPYFSRRIRGTSWSTGCFIAASFLIWALNIDYNRMLELAYLVDDGLFYAAASYAIPILLIVWAGLAIPLGAKALERDGRGPRRREAWG